MVARRGPRASGESAEFEQERDRFAAVATELEAERCVVGERDLDPSDIRSRPGQRVEDGDRLAVAGRVDPRREMADRRLVDGGAELQRLAPATDQVEVDLVRFGAGYPVVVGAEQQLRQALSIGSVGNRAPINARSWRTSRPP